MPNPEALRVGISNAWKRSSVRRACRRLRDANPVLVYQIGKVGSSSIVETLETMRLGVPVLQCHTLRPERIRQLLRDRPSPSRVPRHLLVSQAVATALKQGLFPCSVISPVREPVARAISFAFEDWRRKLGTGNPGDALDPVRMRQVVSRLLENDTGHADPTRWFTLELQATFGIDVFARPFDRERGFSIERGGLASCLVLRVEELNRVLTHALASFLEIDELRVRPKLANVGAGKWYSDVLTQVKSEFRLPRDILERLYATRYAQHFYGAEIPALMEKWSG